MKNIPPPRLLRPDRFLRELDERKDNYARTLLWLSELGLISLRDPTASISALIARYNRTLSDLRDFAALPDADRFLIQADAERSAEWFRGLIAQAGGFDPDDVAGDMTAVRRILSVIRCSTGCYLQGYERYACVSYLLARIFASAIDERSDFAEAIAYYICDGLLRIVKVSRLTADAPAAQRHFARLDEVVRRAHPAEYAAMFHMNVSAIYYALKWEMLTFADEYPSFFDILLLWDQVIVHRGDIDRFIFALCSAHVRNIRFDSANAIPIEAIQHHQVWDVKKIIRETNASLERERWKRGLIWSAVAVAVLVLTYSAFGH